MELSVLLLEESQIFVSELLLSGKSFTGQKNKAETLL